VRYLIENLIGEASKLGIMRNATKELIQDMFNRVAYAMIMAEYESAMGELTKYRRELVVWVE